jgi:2,3-bisphosphoglycerate-dependent phosphoglycerate mutase
MSPFHVLLLRHGETDSNATAVIQGWLPVPLNATGHRQARRLAERLRTFEPRVRRLESSDLVRAVQTAEPIAAALGLGVTTHTMWRERGLGQLEGKPVAEHVAWRALSGEATPPGAESVGRFQQRAYRAMRALPQLGPDASPVAVVTHGGTIRSVLRLLFDGRLKLAPDQSLGAAGLVMVANCSIMHLIAEPDPDPTAAPHDEHDGLVWRIACVNDVAHLADAKVTARDSG